MKNSEILFLISLSTLNFFLLFFVFHTFLFKRFNRYMSKNLNPVFIYYLNSLP